MLPRGAHETLDFKVVFNTLQVCRFVDLHSRFAAISGLGQFPLLGIGCGLDDDVDWGRRKRKERRGMGGMCSPITRLILCSKSGTLQPQLVAPATLGFTAQHGNAKSEAFGSGSSKNSSTEAVLAFSSPFLETLPRMTALGRLAQHRTVRGVARGVR